MSFFMNGEDAGHRVVKICALDVHDVSEAGSAPTQRRHKSGSGRLRHAKPVEDAGNGVEVAKFRNGRVNARSWNTRFCLRKIHDTNEEVVVVDKSSRSPRCCYPNL